MLRIDEMFAFVSVDEYGEGLVGTLTRTGWMPLVGADLARMDSLRAVAQQVARDSGRDVKLLRFSGRTELETFSARE